MSNARRDLRPRALAVRAAAAALLLVLGAAVTGRADCPMRPPEPEAQQRDAHDCCKKGLTGAMPGCCHADTGTAAVILLKTPAAVTLPAASLWKLPVPLEAASVYGSTSSTAAAHSPPPLVLRI